jgi:hypothetical protein
LAKAAALPAFPRKRTRRRRRKRSRRRNREEGETTVSSVSVQVQALLATSATALTRPSRRTGDENTLRALRDHADSIEAAATASLRACKRCSVLVEGCACVTRDAIYINTGLWTAEKHKRIDSACVLRCR